MGFLLLGVKIALEIAILVLFARAILSWFPLRPGTPMAAINDFLVRITEPVLAPLRKVIPRAGMFDLSFLVLMVFLLLLLGFLGGVG